MNNEKYDKTVAFQPAGEKLLQLFILHQRSGFMIHSSLGKAEGASPSPTMICYQHTTTEAPMSPTFLSAFSHNSYATSPPRRADAKSLIA